MLVGDIRKEIDGVPDDAPVMLVLGTDPSDDVNVVIDYIAVKDFSPKGKKRLVICVSVLTDEELEEDEEVEGENDE